ncbi:alpha/beta hydrolase [Aporhodopirellula aestuarii]|uniref:Lysophospholipase n=1 Tax=Aporhodopirellula aestuarii TaxID=2950107 RepID=A0ABT0UA69_9BACT|nr:alpha/beta hydrolase [Aporhodopirellula aestuarii]MCM2373584.1 lysophospholipase [Aporhodopirellula aestuarii]
MPILPDDTLVTPDERTLHCRHSGAVDADSVVVIVHGLGEHSGWYAELADQLSAVGMASLAYDQHGHGKSPGRRGDAPTLQTLVDDIGVAVASAQENWPEAEVVLLGHSMGGHLVLRYLMQQSGTTVRHAIVTNPMILPKNPPTKPQAFAAWLTSKVIPRVRFSADIEPTELTTDTEMLRELANDPLTHEQLSIGIGGALMSSGHELRERASEISQETLFLLGGQDTLCDEDSTQRMIEAMPSATRVVFEDAKHSLLIEEQRELVYEAMLDWFRQTNLPTKKKLTNVVNAE